MQSFLVIIAGFNGIAVINVLIFNVSLLCFLCSGFCFCFRFFWYFRSLGFAGFGFLAAIRVLWCIFPQKRDLLSRNVSEVDRKNEKKERRTWLIASLARPGFSSFHFFMFSLQKI